MSSVGGAMFGRLDTGLKAKLFSLSLSVSVDGCPRFGVDVKYSEIGRVCENITYEQFSSVQFTVRTYVEIEVRNALLSSHAESSKEKVNHMVGILNSGG